MRVRLFSFGFILLFCSVLTAQNITGFWRTIDDKTNKPNSVVAVYPYEGKYYVRIIGSFNEQGEIDDSIYNPQGRAPGIVGHPYYSGLDFVWDAVYQGGGRFAGYVIDPRNGNIYNAQLRKKGDNLILRGELLIFGRNQEWPPFPEDRFNDKFKKPDISTFVPVIPKSVD